jgi:predicted short-subunit dehydrogenase-like oxidoreductase (DUF2520 family)
MKEVIVIGAGNLGWHLVQVLSQAGHDVSLVSRAPDRVAEWPVRVIAMEDLPARPSLVFLAVPDNAINRVSAHLSQLLPSDVPLVHTSGATPAIMIHSHFEHRGAFWPIRSLRAGEEVTDWRDVPLVYYGTSTALTQVLGELAGKLSQLSYLLDDQQRAKLHLSAVFSNNFVTWLYQISYELCEQSGIPFDILLPIIRNTALKQDGTAPRLSQTGAAARGDTTTMNRHLELLNTQPEYADLYRRMSHFIQTGVPS